MSGVRSVKFAEGLKHEYVTQNGRVVRDYVTNASTGAFVRCLDFFYDEAGRPFAMRSYYDSTITGYDTFHYVLNAQGDVVQLNYQGRQDRVYAQYTYDAWGNLLSVSPAQSDDPTIAAQNPLRYRGYYYDTETGFCYLQSRYYDPIVRRFINADSYGSTGTGLLGYNMFAYCENNPVNSVDQAGHRPLNVNTMMTDSGGGFIPAPCSAYYTPEYVQYCQYYGYSLKETYIQYFNSSVEACAKDAIITVRNTLSSWDDTCSAGFSFAGTLGMWNYNYQIGISIDFKGNIALQHTTATGTTTSNPYGSACVFVMITDAPSVNHLNGPGYQFGGSVSIPSPALTASMGGEFNIIDAGSKYYYGATGLFGITTPGEGIGELHAEWGNTNTILSINIFDILLGY